MLILFVNRFLADDKYSLLHRENLMPPIEMMLSQKQKMFSDFLNAVLKSKLYFK